MAKVRQVNTFFWDDPYIEELCKNGKLLFIYLITTPLTNIAGSFEITVKKMHDHTGIDKTEIHDLLKRFEADGKCIYKDRWMLVCNTIEHQHWQTHKTIKAGIIDIVSHSPDWVKDRLGIVYDWLSHLNLNSNLNSNSNNGVPPNAANAATEPVSVEKRIWTDGVDLLSKSGLSEQQARPLLGRWARDFGKLELASAIAVTQAANVPDPKAYIGGIIRKSKEHLAASQVGKSDYVEESVNCPTCFDTGEKQIFPNQDSIEGAYNVPCPDCVGKLEKAA